MMRCASAARICALGAGLFLGACALRHDMAPTSPCGGGAASHIRWWGSTDPDDRAANRVRCRTVGNPVVVPAPASGFDALRPGDSLAVFSWNMAVGAADLISFLRDEVGLTCAGPGSHPGKRYRHVVVILQEAYRHSDALPALDDPRLAGSPAVQPQRADDILDVVETAARCGLAAAYLPSGRNGADRPGQIRVDKGNAILSTLPLDDLVAIEIPFETERKVALVATVPLPRGKVLRIASVHLDVVTNFRRALLSGNQNRTRQVGGVVEALDSLERSEGAAPPTVVGGDFNTWSGSAGALRLLRAAFPDSPPWSGQGTRGPFPTDHIFFRENESADPEIALSSGSYRRLDSRYGSDHEPLFVWLSLVSLEGHAGGR